MPELVEDDEVDINFLLSQSLITISTLPFHLVNDLWRWKIFAGEGRNANQLTYSCCLISIVGVAFIFVFSITSSCFGMEC